MDKQLDDLISAFSSGAAIIVSESFTEDVSNGELVAGLSTSSVGVVGGEDGFCGFYVKSVINKCDLVGYFRLFI